MPDDGEIDFEKVGIGDSWPHMHEVIVIRRRRRWEWQVRDQHGGLLMRGRERARQAARYQCYRALFMLLANSWRLTDLRTLQGFRRMRRPSDRRRATH